MAQARIRQLKIWARSTAVALSLSCAPVLAQDVGESASESPGMPRNILPPEVSAMPLGTPEARMPGDVPAEVMPGTMTQLMPAQSLQGRTLPSRVTVGDLGTLEGPVAGTLTDLNGGLGYEAWQGSD